MNPKTPTSRKAPAKARKSKVSLTLRESDALIAISLWPKSQAELARSLGITRTSVKRHFDNLLKKGVIHPISKKRPIIKLTELGEAMVKIKNVLPKGMRTLDEQAIHQWRLEHSGTTK